MTMMVRANSNAIATADQLTNLGLYKFKKVKRKL